MTPLYPLTFQPLFKRYLWGGRRLGELLHKPIGPESDYAESWEIADHRQGQSIVASGPLAGLSLHELVTTRGKELLGRHAPQTRFPLIFKYLDCQRDLSVQVHPNDAAAALLDPPDLGKTEAWLVLAAEAGSRIYAGLKPNCDRASLVKAIEAGAVETCLHSFTAAVGQCIFVPAGTVHGLGAGMVVAEIQQASDTTYRLYDWNRVGPDGRPRQLHIRESLEAIDYNAVAVKPREPQATDRPFVQRLVACDKFILDRWSLKPSAVGNSHLGGEDRLHLVSVLAGKLVLSGAFPQELTTGQTALLPACLGPIAIHSHTAADFIDMYLPA
jgi:mannose-6-phosphate isomerase